MNDHIHRSEVTVLLQSIKDDPTLLEPYIEGVEPDTRLFTPEYASNFEWRFLHARRFTSKAMWDKWYVHRDDLRAYLKGLHDDFHSKPQSWPEYIDARIEASTWRRAYIGDCFAWDR